MSRSPDWIRLRHMLDASLKAQSIVGSRDAIELAEDETALLALERLIAILGEAAGRLSRSTTDRMPGIPWPQVVGMRNILVHAYFEVEVPRLLATVNGDLPPLIVELERILREDGHLD